MLQWLVKLCCYYVTLNIVIKAETSVTDYCIVGAGPAGLQLGYFLQKSSRKYVIFEKGSVPGNFFVKYPRHGRLISINKRHTGKTNVEFNMRHDWNSLLSDDVDVRFTRYSKEFFPPKQALLDYLRDYSEMYNLNIKYNTTISDITSIPESMTTMKDQYGNRHTCKVLVMATGYSKENQPTFRGVEHVTPYGQVSVNSDDFEGKSVLILGRGNSAFEVADSILGSTNLVHMLGRSRVKLSWETHYVGDLRAINNGLLDTYQLKSLDGVVEAPVSMLTLHRLPNGKLKVNTTDPALIFDNFSLRDEYDEVVMCLGFTYDFDVFKGSDRQPRPHHLYAKFPHIKDNYESAHVPGIYFAGTSTHSLDFKKSAGGFIHGFRYTAKALFNLLEWKYQGVPWPYTSQPWSEIMNTVVKRTNEASGTYQMFSVLGDIILIDDEKKEFHLLQEVPVKLLGHLYENCGRRAQRAIVMLFEYGKEFSGAGKDIFRTDRATGEPAEAHRSNFLHPVFYYYSTLPTEADMFNVRSPDVLPRPDRMHHIVEDFLTDFDAQTSHLLPLRRFFETSFGEDLRHRFSDECFELALTQSSLPIGCKGYMSNQGLYAAF